MRQARLAPLPIIVQIAVPLAMLVGLIPGIARAAGAAASPVAAAAPAANAAPATANPAPIVGHADAGRHLYTAICAYCHRLGDSVSEVGAPGLTGAIRRYGEPWLERWLADPGGFSGHDAKARTLIAANPYGLVMPTLPSMQDAQNRADVIAFLRQLEAGGSKGSAPAQ